MNNNHLIALQQFIQTAQKKEASPITILFTILIVNIFILPFNKIINKGNKP